jgi:DNA-binding winged helix-turn-helix (wHTH) protein
VWGDSFDVEPRTVDVHINRLRRSLKSEGKGSIVRTVRSAGYCLQTFEDDSEFIQAKDEEVLHIEDMEDI